MVRLSHDRIGRLRDTPGATALLFITDRCPVGCAHCSVDSRPDSPRITDFALFEQIVDRLCADPGYQIVGISGGEPFIERRALTYATRRLHEAGKQAVVYTSGFWGKAGDPPPWIHQVLDHCAAVYLSTDAYHEAGTGPGPFVDAARAVAAHGLPIVVQVVADRGMPERAADLLHQAFGSGWREHAEVVPTPGLDHGRGAEIYHRETRSPGRALGHCTLVNAPVVRYDGRVAVCCNESVLMGGGPAALRRDCADAEAVGEALADFRQDPLYRAIGSVDSSVLTRLPVFGDLADREFSTICGLCWAMTRRVGASGESGTVLRSLGILTGGTA
ncbi:radical SAM protein [Streptomyces sp. V4-01]|uniref:Radical SAM protein n=1 Tax=Actinacidiphila polyblastidii TaxID=3110430 RepID=A0ABU7PM24_9ACTN|nr:radical SAM protein [Streptomyces sp. V4-01]